MHMCLIQQKPISIYSDGKPINLKSKFKKNAEILRGLGRVWKTHDQKLKFFTLCLRSHDNASPP